MQTPSLWTIFWTFLKLGCTSFGGPIAHLGYFHASLITQRQWLTADKYSSLVALCHFIPGPTSSQVGLGIGYHLHGWRGAIAAWSGFTLPSALLMTMVAIGLLNNDIVFTREVVHLLKLVAIAVVIQAIIQMSSTLLPRWSNRILCIACFIIVISSQALFEYSWVPYVVIIVAGITGRLLLKPVTMTDDNVPATTSSCTHAFIGIVIFISLLILLPIITQFIDKPIAMLFDSLYRIGATVFGGGHVVLPLMRQEVMNHSSISSDMFLTGYSLAQAVPGPLFTLASYVGALWLSHSPWLGAIVATIAIFLPSFIIVPSLLILWQKIQHHNLARGVLAGVNAAVISLLATVLYNPLITSSVVSITDITIIGALLMYLFFLKWPIWIAILTTIIVSSLFLS